MNGEGGLFYFYVFFKFSTLTISLVSKKKKKENSKQLRPNKLTFDSHHPRVHFTPFLASRCPCPGDPAVPPSG